MVEIAWRDGTVAALERNAVLNAAVSQGVQPDTCAYELLKHWLDERPDSHIIDAWKAYIKELAHLMPKESLAKVNQHARPLPASGCGRRRLSRLEHHLQARAGND